MTRSSAEIQVRHNSKNIQKYQLNTWDQTLAQNKCNAKVNVRRANVLCCGVSAH